VAVADSEIWSRSDNSDSITAHSVTGCGLFGPIKPPGDNGALLKKGVEEGISFRFIYKLFKSGGGELQKFSQYDLADKPGLGRVQGTGTEK
jgi:hypothetical protein